MSTEDLVEAVRQSGWVLRLDGDTVRCSLPAAAAHLAAELRAHKQELIPLLKRNAGYFRAFPCCPQCGSYALYRQNDVGRYECLSCNLPGIEESDARKAGAAKDAEASRNGTDSETGN